VAIELHQDRLVIRREGLIAKAAGLGPTREIPLAALSGITLKPASRARNGHLQLHLGGEPPRDHIGDPNNVIFQRKHSPEFAELADHLRKQLAKNAEEGIDPATIEFDRGTSRLDKIDERSAALKAEATIDDEGGYRRQAIPERVRHEVWRRDQGRCVDCGSRERLEYDHIVPVSRGGSNTARNIELRCEPCNRRKAAKV